MFINRIPCQLVAEKDLVVFCSLGEGENGFSLV